MNKFEQYAGGGTGFRGREENPRLSRRFENFQSGDKVTVVRSSGAVEHDWTFQHQRMDTDEILVVKSDSGERLEKELTPDQFRAMQQESENKN